MDSGAGKATGGGLSFNRRSTVSLMGNWGEVRLGRDDSATFLNTLIFDPFLTNGVGGTGAFTMLGIPGIPLTGGAPIQISNAVSYFCPRTWAASTARPSWHSASSPAARPTSARATTAACAWVTARALSTVRWPRAGSTATPATPI
jgi:hypothetical protein